MEAERLTADQLREHGLLIGKGEGLLQHTRWEAPTFLLDARRVKNCEFGAFTYVGEELHPALGYATGWSMLMDYVLNPAICAI